MESGDKAKKVHKKRVSGGKLKKKKEKENVDRHNPKAFTFSGGTKSVQKRVQFTLDKQANKERVEKIDKTPDVAPPFIVVVQGPPGVGKTTLVRSLVRHYCKQRLLQLRGPITLVSGRQRRITIVECPQDMSAMLDLAKVADLVLLLIDASFGFELETFEFINILQNHGFPRVIGVLTHLDGFAENKQLRKVKKTMKHRFWTEVYEGAKLFYLSGLQHGRYHRLEVQNLARFIAVTKHSILSWRQSHPYMLCLRWEDQTPPALPAESARTLDLYGYVCGGRLREGSQVHLAGIGDYVIDELKTLPDPCPLPVDVEAERLKSKGIDRDAKEKKKNALRSLAERHRVVYAPGSDVGSITVDSDAMYIHLPEHQVGFTQKDDNTKDEDLPEAVRLVRELQSGAASSEVPLVQRRGLRLVQGGAELSTKDADAMGSDSVGQASSSRSERRPVPLGSVNVDVSGKKRGTDTGAGNSGDEASSEACDDEDEEEEEEEDLEGCAGSDDDDAGAHREAVLERARRRFERGPRLDEVIYGNAGTNLDVADSNPEEKVGPTDHTTIALFDEDEDDAGNSQSAKGGSVSKLLGNSGDVDGMDTTRMVVLPGEVGILVEEDRKEKLKDRKFITGGWSSAEEDGDEEKENRKTEGDNSDEEGAETAEGDKKEGTEDKPDTGSGGQVSSLGVDSFEDGAHIASFVRVRLQGIPAACVVEIKRERPLLLGGLLPGESKMGYVQMRVKRHRWHPKLLKSGDALLLSIGWRRYQTLPTFSLEDRGEKRMRMLKYTLEHAHCMMTCYGPLVPPNTGVLAFRSWDKVSHFRISATGGVMESAADFEIKKKLKLTGEPYKIFKNTAFIKNMFTSDLEVSKYLHAKIQTISGIRGEVKKAEGNRGSFRATFEDRILMSDLVICKCWINVEPKKFYHPVVDVAGWRAARLIGELRANAGVPIPDSKDSHYGAQNVRPERKFNPLRVPQSLKKAIPFKSMHKVQNGKSKNKLRKKTAVVSSERDKEINGLLTRLQTVRKEKHRIRQVSNQKRKAKKDAQEKFIQDKREIVKKEARKKRYIKEGQQEQHRRKAMRLD